MAEISSFKSPVIPEKLPLKKLNLKRLKPGLKKAYRKLTEFSAILKNIPNPQKTLTLLTVEEAINSVGLCRNKKMLAQLFCPELYPKKSKEIQSILQCREALKDALKKPLNTSFLLQLHRRVKKGFVTQKADLGRFRNRQNWIGPEGGSIEEGRFFPPKASQVPAYMKNLQDYLFSEEQDPLVQLAIYFAQLLIIHPFMDGNGRVGRIFLSMFLYQKQLTSHPLFYWSGYCKRHHKKYFDRLFNISAKRDWEGWILFFLKGIVEEGERNCKKAKALEALYKKWADQLLVSFPPSQVKRILGFLFENPIFPLKKIKTRNFAVLQKICGIRRLSKVLICEPILFAASASSHFSSF